MKMVQITYCERFSEVTVNVNDLYVILYPF